MTFLATYVLAIVAINVGFAHFPLIDLGPLGLWPPMSLMVGGVFVLRDFTQRSIGHHVWWGTATGILLSYFMASPYIALASASAFAVSEAIDWGVYTWCQRRGRTFRSRVLWSSALGTPTDSVVFLFLIGHFSLVGVATMTASKMLAAGVVWIVSRK